MTARHRKEALARALARQWADDESFRRALLRLYRAHCRDLPAGPGDAIPNPLKDAIAKHYGEALTAPSMQPAFAHWNLADVDDATGDPEAGAWARAYLAAVARLARRYGLDRWQPARPPATSRSYGAILVHEWCTLRAGYGFGPQRFADAVGSQPGWVPRRAAKLELDWDPRQESYAAARTRLRSRVDAEMKAISDEWQAQAAGFKVRIAPSTDRDARWLFERLRGRTVPAIAGSEDDAPWVQTATTRLAKTLGVEFR